MKTYKQFILGAALLFSLFIIAACKTTPQEKGAYSVYIFEKKTPLSAELGNSSPKMTFSFAVLNPSDSAVRKIMYGNKDAKGYVSDTVYEYEEEYKAIKSELLKSASSNWTYEETSDIFYRTSRVLVINRNKDSYTGGAHGIHEGNYYVIDLNTMKQISMGDVFKPDSMSGLKKTITEVLRRDYNVPAGKELTTGGFFENDIKMPSVFYFSPEGMGFFWNQYEIAPYSMGAIKAEIPVSSLKDYMTSYGLSLFSGGN